MIGVILKSVQYAVKNVGALKKKSVWLPFFVHFPHFGGWRVLASKYNLFPKVQLWIPETMRMRCEMLTQEFYGLTGTTTSICSEIDNGNNFVLSLIDMVSVLSALY
jgi:hypothetical protein